MMSSNTEDSEALKPVYDKISIRDGYLAEINPAQIHRRRLTRRFLRFLRINPRKILDIGCGTGELIGELSHIYPHAQLYGGDLSSISVKLTMARVPLGKYYCFNAEEIQGEIFDTPMDLITCCEVLEHCLSPDRVVKNACLWLNTGGVFFLSVPSGPMTLYDQTIGHQHHYTIQEVRTLLESVGFMDVHVQSWGAPFHTLYRELIRVVSNGFSSKESVDPNRYSSLYRISSRVFNLLFYFNVNYGRQIFGYGYKNGKSNRKDKLPIVS